LYQDETALNFAVAARDPKLDWVLVDQSMIWETNIPAIPKEWIDFS